MTPYQQFQKEAYLGDCSNCGHEGFVKNYARNSASPLAHLGPTMRLCFLCSHAHGANAQEYPQQHPYHDYLVRPILSALMLVLAELKPPKKPRKPKTEGPVVRPMTRRK